jgi:hypothetical protein
VVGATITLCFETPLPGNGIGSMEFLQGIRKLKYHAVVGVQRNRKLVDGHHVSSLYKRGQQVRLDSLPFWFPFPGFISSVTASGRNALYSPPKQ